MVVSRLLTVDDDIFFNESRRRSAYKRKFRENAFRRYHDNLFDVIQQFVAVDIGPIVISLINRYSEQNFVGFYKILHSIIVFRRASRIFSRKKFGLNLFHFTRNICLFQ